MIIIISKVLIAFAKTELCSNNLSIKILSKLELNFVIFGYNDTWLCIIMRTKGDETLVSSKSIPRFVYLGQIQFKTFEIFWKKSQK